MEAKKDGRGGFGRDVELQLTWQLPQGRETITVSADNAELTSSEGSREAPSPGKEDSSEFRGPVLPASSESFHVSPFQM